MSKAKQLTFNQYTQSAQVLTEYTSVVLKNYADISNENRDRIIRNLIARSITALRGIINLWSIQDYNDCWVLYRVLLDRLFYLETLGTEESFGKFSDWCFINSFEYKMKCLNDPEFAEKIEPEKFVLSEEDKKRYESLKTTDVNWKKPSAFKVAKKMKLDFLYNYGYRFASGHVHPTANEGMEDVARLTGQTIDQTYDDQITVIHNSSLIMNIILRQGINFSNLEWRSAILTFLDQHAAFITGLPNKYINSINVIRKLVSENTDFCRSINVNTEKQKDMELITDNNEARELSLIKDND